jgi:hypothetical protein
VSVISLEQTLEALARAGMTADEPSVGVTVNGTPMCFVHDPDGYRIELLERPDAA